MALQDAAGNVTRASYNPLGHRTSVNDPNQGGWTFTYNALGELTSQTDDRLVTTAFKYDKLGRRSQRTATAQADAADPALDAIVDTYYWDPANARGATRGHRRTIDGVLEREELDSYDAYSRLQERNTTQFVSAGTYRSYTHRWVFDSGYGRVKAEVYPNNVARQWVYSKYGHPIQELDPVDGAQYRRLDSTNGRGQPLQETLGGFTASTSYYPATGQMQSIAHTAGAAVRRRQDYRYDVFGNLRQRTLDSGVVATPPVETLSYDKLHRLTIASRSGGASGVVSYAYDEVGNFLTKSDYSIASGYIYGNVAKSAGGNAGPHAVRQITRSAAVGGGTVNFIYDDNGNLTAVTDPLIPFNAQYDQSNLPTHTQRGGGISRMTYGADDSRARQTGTDGTRIYLDAYEDVVVAGGGATVETRAYFGDYAVVSEQADGARMTEYLLRDRLGSVDAVATPAGDVTEKRAYDAFGAPRNGSNWADMPQLTTLATTQKGFTQHEHLNSVRLIHMNGRAYDYRVGRFLSVDPFVQFPLNGQSLNPYSYILNNPMSGTDPTGYLIEWAPNILGERTFWLDKLRETYGRSGNQTSARPLGGITHTVEVVTLAAGKVSVGGPAPTRARAKQNGASSGQGAIDMRTSDAGRKGNSGIGSIGSIAAVTVANGAVSTSGTPPSPNHHRSNSNLLVKGSAEFQSSVSSVEAAAAAAGITVFADLRASPKLTVIVESEVTDFRAGISKAGAALGVVRWDPDEAALVSSSPLGGSESRRYQSAALGLIHELGHAHQYSIQGLSGNLPEKSVVFGIESSWARHHGEPIRHPARAHGGIGVENKSPFWHSE